MLALRSAPPIIGIAEAERAARDLYGLAVSLRALSGERDCNFHARTADGDEYVLKILGADPLTADCQVGVLRHLAEQAPGLPVPTVYATQVGADLGVFTQDGHAYSTLLTGFLPGELLWDAFPDHSLLRNVGGLLARIDRALQGFSHAALAQRLAWDLRSLPELAQFSGFLERPDVRLNVENAVTALQTALPALRGLRSQAIHGDGHGGNVLIGAANVACGVLDFGDMVHAPLIVEPAVAMAELITPDAVAADALCALLEGYAGTLPLETADIAVLYDLIAARNAVTLLIHAWREQHDRPGARALDVHAEHAARSLETLRRGGRAATTALWHRAAGTAGADAAVSIDLGRRRQLLGTGAELFYAHPLHLIRGEGVWLYDPLNRPYLDVYNNVAHVGHCHPTVVRAIQQQTALLTTHTRYLHERILQYAERLTALCPPHLDTCLFVNSGSEANDVAWRMAQLATGHGGALVMAHAYHGVTDAAAALTRGVGTPEDPRVGVLAVPPDVRVHETLDPTSLAAAAEDADRAIGSLGERGVAPAAFFLDTALTSSGIFDPPQAWLDAVLARVRSAGALVVADEVQYGLGRSGSHFFGFERRGLSPDIVTLGKPVGNGFPMGVVIASRPLVEAFQARFGFFSTFGGNPVAAAAGLAVLDVLAREALMTHAATTGEYLRHRLAKMAARHECFGAVRGTGLLLGLDVLGDSVALARRRTQAIVNALAARARILIGSEGPLGTILKLRPPMPFRREHADLLVRAIDAAARDVMDLT